MEYGEWDTLVRELGWVKGKNVKNGVWRVGYAS